MSIGGEHWLESVRVFRRSFAATTAAAASLNLFRDACL